MGRQNEAASQAENEIIQAVLVYEDELGYRLLTSNYTIGIIKSGFRYSFEQKAWGQAVEPHPVSGLSFGAAAAPGFEFDSEACQAADECALVSSGPGLVHFTIANQAGETADVRFFLFERYVRMEVTPHRAGTYTIEARTAPVAPIYGLGDYGAQVDTVATEQPPAKGKLDIPARDGAELTGYVRRDMVNQGTNMRYISSFAVSPAHRYAQVVLEEGSKRAAFTSEQAMLGVGSTRSMDKLYYFMGTMPEIYSDYKSVREREGYIDKQPKYTMFRVGWEAYGSLGWNCWQAEVQAAIAEYGERGYDLAWGVIGSGFWKGDRKSRQEGTTTSFNLWDDEYEEGRKDGLPNPRFPDVDGLLAFFAEKGIKLILGIRNHFKGPESDGGYHCPVNNGPYMEEALERGYLLKARDGKLVRITNAQFPQGTVYMLDSRNEEALRWFVSKAAAWRSQGFKEDAMIYTKHYADGNWNRLNESLMDEGYLVIVRNSAYSVPGDLIRINDTYYGTGPAFHFDQDRVPINLLNIAASGASNLYPDITGGTPKTDPKLPGYQSYFVRNAMLNCVIPGMSMGRKPWEMNNPDYEAWVKKAADWHNRYSPYIYSAVLDGFRTGYPHAMTPLHIAYPEDAATYGLINRTTRQYEWMLGPSMLAAPVYGNDFDTAEERDVYLPEGIWIDFETGERFQGPVTLKAYPIPKWKIPVFIGGKGVVVYCAPEEGYYAEVYPVAAAGAEYTYTHVDGVTRSTFRHRNAGWNPATLRIVSEAGREAAARFSEKTGSFRFLLEPGVSYTIEGGA
jgi:hypothetical protein